MSEQQEFYYTYIVKCADNTLYCGWTTDVEKRLDAHNGRIKGGAKYTRGRRPVELVHVESFHKKEEAQAREYAIKQLSRRQKEKLIGQNRLGSK